MTATEAFVTRHPLRTYFALAFAVSWAGVLFVVGPGGIPTTIEHLITVGPAMYVAMLTGPLRGERRRAADAAWHLAARAVLVSTLARKESVRERQTS